MRALGVVRKIDELGRVVIPVEVRRRFGIDVKDSVEIYIDDNDSIILKKYEPACIFCGDAKDVFNYNGKNICKNTTKCTGGNYGDTKHDWLYSGPGTGLESHI